MSINSKTLSFLLLIGVVPVFASEFQAIESTRISDDFGPRIQDPTIPGKVASNPHPGIDFANPPGISIHAVEDSIITEIGFNAGGKGWFVVTQSQSEPVRKWRYQHMFSMASTSSTTAGSGLFRVFPSTSQGVSATIVFYLDTGRRTPLKFRNEKWSLDYAVLPSGELGRSHRFSLGARF